jgi:uncharacterized protein YbaR (Trm112 family)
MRVSDIFKCGLRKGNSGNRDGASMRQKHFDPEKFGMVACPICKSEGYVQNSKRQCCPKCGGFGFIKDERENLEEDKE